MSVQPFSTATCKGRMPSYSLEIIMKHVHHLIYVPIPSQKWMQ